MTTTTEAGKIWTQPLASLEAVIGAIKHLNLPEVSRENMIALATCEEKNRFKKSLEECVGLTGTQPEKETKGYVCGLVSCISIPTTASLSSLGYPPAPVAMLIYIGSRNGMAFRSAINAAMTPNDPNRDVAIGLINSYLTEASEQLGIEYKFDGAGASAPEIQTGNNVRNFERPAPAPAAAPQQPSRNQEAEAAPAQLEPETPSVNMRLSTHVYGGSAALCFNAAKSKDLKNFTLLVDAATSKGERSYDWQNAIHIQLGHKELPLLYAVLAGWRSGVKFAAHGAQNDKSLEIKRQGDKGSFYISVTAKGEKVRGVPVNSQDALPIMLLTFDQIMNQVPDSLKNRPDIVLSMMKASQSLDAEKADAEQRKAA